MTPTLTGIDHIHLYVKNREISARWYQQTLGFQVFWTTNDKGPLKIEDRGGNIQLALFNSEDFNPCTAVAFGCDGKAFLQWKSYLETHNLLNRCTDRKDTWSLYFNDPDDNGFEITSFDYDFIADGINSH